MSLRNAFSTSSPEGSEASHLETSIWKYLPLCTQTSFTSLLLQSTSESTLRRVTTGLPLKPHCLQLLNLLSRLTNVIYFLPETLFVLLGPHHRHSPATSPAFLGALSAPKHQSSSFFFRCPQLFWSPCLDFEKKSGMVSGFIGNGCLKPCDKKNSEAVCSVSDVCHGCWHREPQTRFRNESALCRSFSSSHLNMVSLDNLIDSRSVNYHFCIHAT